MPLSTLESRPNASYSKSRPRDLGRLAIARLSVYASLTLLDSTAPRLYDAGNHARPGHQVQGALDSPKVPQSSQPESGAQRGGVGIEGHQTTFGVVVGAADDAIRHGLYSHQTGTENGSPIRAR